MKVTFIIVLAIGVFVLSYMNTEHKKIISELNNRLKNKESIAIYYEEALVEISKNHEGIVDEAFANIK